MLARWRDRAAQIVRDNRAWWWSDVAVPWLVTRAMLLAVAWWFAPLIPRDPAYPIAAAVARGWHFSPIRTLDIWGRWDTGWYLGIAAQGYRLNGDIHLVQSNIGFFPVYPLLVRAANTFLPPFLPAAELRLLAGVLASNAMLLLGLAFVRTWTASQFDGDTARRAVWLMLIFPAGFYFSAAYTEATFMCLLAATLLAGSRHRWLAAGVCGALLAATRLQGVLVLAPLAWLAAEEAGWHWRRVRPGVLWLLLVPGGLLAFLLSIYPLTGDLLAPLTIQQYAWGHGGPSVPWETLWAARDNSLPMLVAERATAAGVLALAVVAWWRLPSKAYALYILLMALVPLAGGTVAAFMRYSVPVFPLFALLAALSRRYAALDRAVTFAFPVLQALMMALWSQFYAIN